MLTYASPRPAPPRKLTLEETDSFVRVTFAVLPTWASVLPGILCAVAGTITIAGVILEITAFRHLQRQILNAPPVPPPAVTTGMRNFGRLLAAQMAMLVFYAIIFWTEAAYHWWKYRRWGRVPRVLTAGADVLTESRLGWWRMRERRWPASEIKAIQLRPVWGNLSRKLTVAKLYIHPRQGRRLLFVLSSADPQLPSRIAERLASVLGCPLT